ncbi:hypothetical protein [Agrobacterium rosae]|nr:hypothetical protein [Agrobacterium rosae]
MAIFTLANLIVGGISSFIGGLGAPGSKSIKSPADKKEGAKIDRS